MSWEDAVPDDSHWSLPATAKVVAITLKNKVYVSSENDPYTSGFVDCIEETGAFSLRELLKKQCSEFII